MEKLDGISHLRQLLFYDVELIELIQLNMGSFILHFDDVERVKVSEITARLEKRSLMTN